MCELRNRNCVVVTGRRGLLDRNASGNDHDDDGGKRDGRAHMLLESSVEGSHSLAALPAEGAPELTFRRPVRKIGLASVTWLQRCLPTFSTISADVRLNPSTRATTPKPGARDRPRTLPPSAFAPVRQ